jgi:hypothetical protein
MPVINSSNSRLYGSLERTALGSRPHGPVGVKLAANSREGRGQLRRIQVAKNLCEIRIRRQGSRVLRTSRMIESGSLNPRLL